MQSYSISSICISVYVYQFDVCLSIAVPGWLKWRHATSAVLTSHICIANNAVLLCTLPQIACIEDEEGGESGGIHGYRAPPTASHMIRGKDDAELGLHGNVVGAVRLYAYSEVPTFLKGNPFITHGYRLYLPTGLCFKR